MTNPGVAWGIFPFMLFAVIIPVRCGLVLLAGGVTWLSSLTDRFIHHTPGKTVNQQTGIYGTACVDKQKNLWIATEGYGLLRYEISTGEGQFYLIDKDSYSVHNSNVIKTVYAEDDCIWCGTVLGEVYSF